ncbi:calcium-binding protein [Azovibrio restrictus]|uniref:calcium-binding protein n=1 Tax=Azovibrio restrictus TaxID=146938 RepID=UPI0026F0EE8B|nr:calcium-binding protein [Azovibrio restrictus]MDD3484001.1 calcium-binding protein [Azovibrio restrictus]
MLISAKDYLEKFGISMEEAVSFVAGNIGQPQVIHQVFKSAGLTTRMLTEIVQQVIPEITSKEVSAYFFGAGLDSVELDQPDFAAIKASSVFTQLTDGAGGTGYNDFDGTDGSDYIRGSDGVDAIDGLGGADFILGEGGNDTLYGGAGENYLEGGDGSDYLIATSSDHSSNILFGNSGNDNLVGSWGNDHLYGGEGADILHGETGDYEPGAGGNDWLDGGSGDDMLYAYGGYDILIGGEGNDTISSFGTYGFSRIDAGAGNDVIYFSQGDQVDAGSGDDLIMYSTGSSSRIANNSADAGHSLLVAGEGADTISFGIMTALEAGSDITLDLEETVSSVDTVGPIYFGSKLASPALVIQGFAVGTDKIDINDVRIYGTSDSIGAVSPSPGSANYAQILTSAVEAYRLPLSSSQKSADDYGKAFFVVQGASAAASDAASAAQLLDAYGNNATYGKSASHYFLVNVGEKDSALYSFTDDKGGDNQVTADELTPVLLLSGVRTEDFSAADLAYTFI